MNHLYATKKNYRVIHNIVNLLNKEEINISQSCAILDYVKLKIAQDTKVGKLIEVDVSNLDEK